MPLRILPLREQDIAAFVAVDDASMAHWGLARAMALSAPPDSPPRPQMVEDWTRKGFADRSDTDTHFLKVVDTDSPPKYGATEEVPGGGEVVACAMWQFRRSLQDEAVKDGEAGSKQRESEEGEAGKPRKLGIADVGVSAEMRRLGQKFQEDFFPHQPYAYLQVLFTHPDHQRRGAGSMLVRWGIEEADKRGVISVLQASKMGLGCYLKQGFQVLRETEVDLNPFGVDDIEIRRGMIRQPVAT